MYVYCLTFYVPNPQPLNNHDATTNLKDAQQHMHAQRVDVHNKTVHLEGIVELMYKEWMSSHQQPFVSMINSCAAILQAFDAFGVCKVIQTLNIVDFQSASAVSFKQLDSKIFDAALRAYAQFTTTQQHELPYSAEMQLLTHSRKPSVIPSFFVVYAQRALLEHLLGALARRTTHTNVVFEEIINSGSGSALHGALTAHVVGLKSLHRQHVIELWQSSELAQCRAGLSNLWNCAHGMGHGFIYWHAFHNRRQHIGELAEGYQPCIVPHILFGSLHLDRADLKGAILVCSWLFPALLGACASGVFHVFFRNSLEFAAEVQQEADKLRYINASLCDTFEEPVSRVCRSQAGNAASGRYILYSASALGLEELSSDPSVVSHMVTEGCVQQP